MESVCEVCGERHHPRQAHRFASNAASNGGNGASNRASDAIDGSDERAVAVAAELEKGKSAEGLTDGPGGGAGSGRKQRWSRDKYNAYQREYMRKRRAQTQP